MDIEYNNKYIDGYFGLIVTLWKAIENGYQILDYSYLSNISENDFENIMKGNVKIPLFDERLNILREVGNIMKNKFNGNFINILNKNLEDIELLDIIISNFKSFGDKGLYDGKEIYFYKRAQLFIADIFQIIDPSIHKIKSISNITDLADYKIPKFLRKQGIIKYSHELADKVDNKIEIIKGSDEEIEIRANTVYCIELIKKIVETKYPNIETPYINDTIWLMSKSNDKDGIPYHLTRTTSY